MNPTKRPSSGQHKAASLDGSDELERLWRQMEKVQSALEENAKETQKNTTAIAVLQLKASLWTIVGAFIATALWFAKELFSGLKGR